MNQGPGEGQERPRRKAKYRIMAEMQGRKTDGTMERNTSREGLETMCQRGLRTVRAMTELQGKRWKSRKSERNIA